MNHFTAFQYIVADNNSELLDLVLDHDRPAALSVLNNLASTRGWGHNTDSALTTAIDKGQIDMVKKLLQLGADVTTSFENWIKTYLVKNPHGLGRSYETNMSEYRRYVAQPIIAAAVKESPIMVEELLAHGADPNTLVSPF